MVNTTDLNSFRHLLPYGAQVRILSPSNLFAANAFLLNPFQSTPRSVSLLLPAKDNIFITFAPEQCRRYVFGVTNGSVIPFVQLPIGGTS